MASSSQLVTCERSHFVALAYDWIVRTHLWVAAGVTALCGFAYSRLSLTPNASTLALPFLSTLLIYNLDTSLDLKPVQTSSLVGEPAQAPHPELIRQRALKLAALALALLLVALGMARWQTGVLVLFGAGLGCLYAVPLGRRGIRLKAAPGIKSLFVGGAVAIAALGVPVVENQAPMSPSSWTTLACMFTLTATNATLFDIRDVAQDGTRALATLPVLFGVGRVRLGLVMFVCSTLGLLSWCDPSLRQHAIVLSACLVPLSLALGPGSPRPAFTWLVDGALWLPWLVTLVA